MAKNADQFIFWVVEYMEDDWLARFFFILGVPLLLMWVLVSCVRESGFNWLYSEPIRLEVRGE